MKNKFTLNIPSPCSADWHQMHASDKGRFCLSCQKTVIDFTNMEDAAIKDFFRKKSGKICGRFQAEQLKEYVLPVQRRPILALLSFLGLTAFMTPVTGFSNPPKTCIQANTGSEPNLLIVEQNQTAGESQVYTVTGKIFDKENKEPIPGVSIFIRGTNLGATSQADGGFKLQISTTNLEKLVLTFSFIGYKTIEKEVAFKNSFAADIQEINLIPDMLFLGEVIYVGQVSSTWYQPRNVWWRVKNLFSR